MVNTKQITVQGFAVNVRDCGQGNPILMVHGFPFNGSMWDEQIKPLATSCRVIVPDLPGFGESEKPKPGEIMTMHRMADLLAELLDELNVTQPVVLCGLSMGGYIAMQFVKYHADRLAGLVLCDTRTGADPPEAAEKRRALAASVNESKLSDVADGMIPVLLCETTLQNKLNVVSRVREMILGSSPEGVAAAALGMAERCDTTELLSGIKVPTLVIVGDSDRPSPPDVMREMASAIPNGKVHCIAQAGHLTPMEQPAVFNEHLVKFLSDNHLV